MKPSASTPLLASNEVAHERRQLLRRNKSLNNISKSSRHAIRAEIFQTPFLAVAGLGGHLRNMSRVFSQRFLHQQGDLSPIEESPMTSEALKRGEFPWPELDERFTFWLTFSVLIASLSAFQVGYNTGVINVPQAVIKATLDPTGPVSDMEWSAIVSVFCVGGLLGSNFAGGLADSMGRKTFFALQQRLLHCRRPVGGPGPFCHPNVCGPTADRMGLWRCHGGGAALPG